MFQHSNSRLTPPDVEARVVEARRARLLALAAELVQDFGHSMMTYSFFRTFENRIAA